MYDEVSLQSGLEEGEHGRDAGVVALTMFALFEAGIQVNWTNHTPGYVATLLTWG